MAKFIRHNNDSTNIPDSVEQVRINKIIFRTKRAEEYLRESLPLLQAEPTLEHFDHLRKFFDGGIRGKVISLHKSIATPLCTLLLRYAGKRTGGLLFPKLTPLAIVSLELFLDFAVQIVEFQEAIERLSLPDLQKLQLHRHIEESDRALSDADLPKYLPQLKAKSSSATTTPTTAANKSTPVQRGGGEQMFVPTPSTLENIRANIPSPYPTTSTSTSTATTSPSATTNPTIHRTPLSATVLVSQTHPNSSSDITSPVVGTSLTAGTFGSFQSSDPLLPRAHKVEELFTPQRRIEVVSRLLLFLVTNYRRFSDYRNYVDSDVFERVQELLQSISAGKVSSTTPASGKSVTFTPVRATQSTPVAAGVSPQQQQQQQQQQQPINIGAETAELKHVETGTATTATTATATAEGALPVALHFQSEEHFPPQGGYFDVDELTALDVWRTNATTGLTKTEVERRRAHYGTNTLPKPPKPGILAMIWRQLTDFMVLILIAAAAVSGGTGDYKAAITLAAVIVINVITGFSQDYKAEKALDALLKFSVPKATIVRESQVSDIPSSELVPGDIVILEEGDQIPADLRLVEAVNLSIIEAPLTGESVAVEKTTSRIVEKNTAIGDKVNLAFMSTVVNHGRGKGIVVCVGSATEIGRISVNITQSKSPQTPLQARLNKLGKILVLFAVILCGLVIGIGIARGRDVEEMIKVGVSLAVSAIPEGLVAVTTVTMALGVQRMAKQNAIIRKLAAVEALGSVTTICSDKTGTLTVGKMSATRLWTGAQILSISGISQTPEGEFFLIESQNNNNNTTTNNNNNNNTTERTGQKITPDMFSESVQKSLMACALCNNSFVQYNSETKEWEVSGDSTEVALNIAAMKAGMSKQDWLSGKAVPSMGSFRFVHEFAFDSDRKRMSVVYEKPQFSEYVVLAKGAPEGILKSCAFVELNGQLVSLTNNQEACQKIEAQSSFMADMGLRVLALAYKTIPKSDATLEQLQNESFVEGGGLVLVALIGLMDPPREGIQEAIAKCHRAGVKVSMITGDHPSTARAIALQLGIIAPVHKLPQQQQPPPPQPPQITITTPNTQVQAIDGQEPVIFKSPSKEQGEVRNATFAISNDDNDSHDSDSDSDSDTDTDTGSGIDRSVVKAANVSGTKKPTPIETGNLESIGMTSNRLRQAFDKIIPGSASAPALVPSPTNIPSSASASASASGFASGSASGYVSGSTSGTSATAFIPKSTAQYERPKGVRGFFHALAHMGRRSSVTSTSSSDSSDSEDEESRKINSNRGLTGGVDRVLRGHEIDELYTSGNLDSLHPMPCVFARVSPENKLQIVSLLQSRGEIAAMTGDGVNDAAALKKSNCGVAMGITGTDITKQAADVVLADDNFATIVVAIEEGRRVYDNIKKFILYLLSCNTAEIFCMLFAVAIGLPIPFTPLMILYANIVADIPPSLCLGFDSAEKDVMDRPPRDPKKGILTRKTIIVLLLQGSSMCAIALVGLYISDSVRKVSLEESQSFCFALLTSIQLFHAFLSRSQTLSVFQANPFNNLLLGGAVLISFAFLLAGIYIPGLNSGISLVPISGIEWAMILLGVFVHFVNSELIKLYIRQRGKARRRNLLRKGQTNASTPLFYNDM